MFGLIYLQGHVLVLQYKHVSLALCPYLGRYLCGDFIGALHTKYVFDVCLPSGRGASNFGISKILRFTRNPQSN